MIARTLVYLTLKWLAESSVCYLRLCRLESRSGLRRALQFGAIRLLLGRGVMLLLWDTSLHEISEPVLGAALVPVLWIEWSIMDLVLAGGRPKAIRLLFAERAEGNLWRLAGVAVSALVNLGAVIAGVRVNELWV